jgi:hypothetical protein
MNRECQRPSSGSRWWPVRGPARRIGSAGFPGTVPRARRSIRRQQLPQPARQDPARTRNLSEASTILREALTAHHEAGNLSGIVWMLHELAGIAFTKQPGRAGLPASRHRHKNAGPRRHDPGGAAPAQPPPSMPAGQAESPAQALPWQEGQQMSQAEAVAEALSEPPADAIV